jgi:hypothetical protein
LVQCKAGAIFTQHAFCTLGDLRMSKYDPLSARLAAHPAEEWRASFSELESVLGFPLPKAARVGRAWWSDDPVKTHSRAWTLHGWSVDDVDHAAEQVVFRRGGEASAAAPEVAPSRTPKPGALALVAAGVAVLAGLGALAARAVVRRR